VAIVVKTLTAFKSNDIESVIASLDSEKVDLLMMYIYKAMELTTDGQTCAHLLAWHSQVNYPYGTDVIMKILSCSPNLISECQVSSSKKVDLLLAH
jgi:actin related protein 2/3 complex subunit 5